MTSSSRNPKEGLDPLRNRLGEETSPYLLQHEDNPVHWWAWGPEALAAAEEQGKPILLSIGYAACHWCHVMAHESFEDPETAAVMNRHFINIKVDREERPDVDAIYMQALHELGQQGGWPLTMFLLPDGRPFFGGTYFPKDERFGRATFVSVMERVVETMAEEPELVSHNADALEQRLQPRAHAGDAPPVTLAMLEDFAGRIVQIMDLEKGGIRGAPKFPQVSVFGLLWRLGLGFDHAPCRSAVTIALNRICQGGIYDHLGGGFARYSVDDRWLVPHFEKMLYDNAQLVGLMTDVWRETRDPMLATRVHETIDWLQREMIAEGQGFAASLDADSEGVEGKFYVWDRSEILDVLGPHDGPFFCDAYDVVEGGNWEGVSILNRLHADGLPDDKSEKRLGPLREALLSHRASRVRPGWDDKVLADWNGLMIGALCSAGLAFDRVDWIALARDAYTFVASTMQPDGRLRHSWRAGQLRGPATAQDYANMIHGALALYQADPDDVLLNQAKRWNDTLNRHYWSETAGGYTLSADDTVDVIVRTRSAHDDAVPNANAMMMSNAMALFQLSGDSLFIDQAERILTAFAGDVARNLVGHCGMLSGTLDVFRPMSVAASGSLIADIPSLAGGQLVRLPDGSGAGADAGDAITAGPLSGKAALDGRPTGFVCAGPQCSLPLHDGDKLSQAVKRERSYGQRQ